MRRLLKASPTGIAALAALALIAPPTALAEVAHTFNASFSVPDTPVSVAVDDPTGDIYVLTTASPAANAGKIYKFDSTGAPSNFSSLGTSSLTAGCGVECRQIAVDNSGGINQGVIYVATAFGSINANKGVYVFLPNGRPSTRINYSSSNPSFEGPYCGTAVDPSGVVYITHGSGTSTYGHFVDTYRPDQILPDPYPEQVWPILGTVAKVEGPSTCRTAVDGNAQLYVTVDTQTTATQFEERPIYGYTVDPFSNSQPAGKLIDSQSTGLATDQSTNELYSNHKTSIARFNEEGELLETFGDGQLQESSGIAVDGATGVVYAANRSTKEIQAFTTVVTPDVTEVEAAASQTGAELSALVGTADAGNVTECRFEYGTTAAYGSTADCEQMPPYSGDKAVSASIGGLSKETAYHYRVVAANANGTTRSPDRTFTTHNVAGVSTDAPTDVTQTSATLNGSFVGNGEETTYHFEWGPTAAYGNTTPTESAGAPSGQTSVSAPITGLSVQLPESPPYHFRLVATNGSGTTFGPDRTFLAAPPDPPTISDVATREVGRTGAVLAATVKPNNGPTVFWVEYGSDSDYGSATPVGEPIGSDEADYPVSTELAGLLPGRTYHYRFVASNFGGTTTSGDRSFTTPNVPLIASIAASQLTESGATLEAVVNPGFRATAYRFEYGLTRSYGGSTPEALVPVAGGEGQRVAADVGGLKPGITYHYRVVASNEQGEAASPDATFTTVPPPPRKQTRAVKPRTVKCRKGFVKRHGKCKRRAPKRKRHKKHKSHKKQKKHGKKRSKRGARS